MAKRTGDADAGRYAAVLDVMKGSGNGSRFVDPAPASRASQRPMSRSPAFVLGSAATTAEIVLVAEGATGPTSRSELRSGRNSRARSTFDANDSTGMAE